MKPTTAFCRRCDSTDCRCFGSAGIARVGGLPPPPVQQASREVLSRQAALKLTRASDVKPENVFYTWEGRIPQASVTYVAGPPGHGKTSLILNVFARLTRGQLAGDLAGHPSPVIIASGEDSFSHTLRPRLEAAGAILESVTFIQIRRGGLVDTLEIPEDINLLKEAIEQVGARAVLIDPFMAHLGASIDSHRDHPIRRALAPLKEVAEDTESSIILIGHLNKSTSSDLFARVGASIGISAAARSILLIAPDPEAPDDSPNRVVVQGKANLGPLASTERFKVEGKDIQRDDGEVIHTSQIAWLGSSEVSIEDVLGREGQGRPTPKLDAAEEMLKRFLKKGPRSVKDIETEAEAKKIGWSTVKSAKDALSIESKQIPEPGKQGPGTSWWWLPNGPFPEWWLITESNHHSVEDGQKEWWLLTDSNESNHHSLEAKNP